MISGQDTQTRTRRAQLVALLDAPGAVGVALDAKGQLVAWPASLPTTPPDLAGRTLLDFAVSADHVSLVNAWREMLHTGSAACTFRLLNRPDHPLFVELGDLRPSDGVLVGVVRSEDGTPIPFGDVPPPRSRVGAIYQTSAGDVVSVDPGYTSMVGWTSEQTVGRSSLDHVHPDDHPTAIDAWLDMMQSGRSHPRRWRTESREGTYLWTEVVVRRLPEPGPEGDVLVEVTDITEEIAARERLEAQELLLNRMAQVVPVGLFQVDTDGRVTYANDRLHRMIGTPAGDALAGVLATVVDTDRHRVLAGIERVIGSGTDEDVEGEVRPTDGGEPRRCMFAVRPLPDRLGVVTGAIVCVSDITETARRLVTLERDLIHRSFHDDLTGLPNRTLLINGLEEAIADSREADTAVAVLIVGLDNFKAVNDGPGHAIGDELLRAVADRIRAVVRPTDLVARVGGDAFAVLMDDYIDPDHPRRTAEQVLATCSLPFEIDGHRLLNGVSIGIATSATAQGTEELLRDADLAMYRAKAAGRGRAETFEPEMHAAAKARVELETSLRQGINEGQLLALYQPIHDLVTGAVSSVEALVRWRHPTHGLVSPADFIPLAEETGLIVPLGRFVLDEACAEAARWTAAAGPAPRVSVNLSARQMASPTILDDVIGALDRSGLDPARLQLEITESVLMDRSEVNAAVLATLRERGVTIAIDDFGTGYSSLAYLEQLPVDVIKVDKAFVDRIENGDRHAKLVKGILSLSHDLGLTTVAEGIETPGQLAELQRLRCAGGQGYLFSRPIDPQALRVYLQASHQPF